MTKLTNLEFYLKLANGAKYHSPSKCKDCGTLPMFLHTFHYLGNEYLGICYSTDCRSNNSDSEKDIYLKMISLFEQSVTFTQDGFAYFEFSSSNQLDICTHWLFEIGHKYNFDYGKCAVKSDITKSQYYRYLYQSQ